MDPADGREHAEDPIAMLANQIADRLAARGLRLVEHAAAAGDAADGLWSARRVASHYGVGVSFVYQHADELGCIRLGGGLRPRLRFDPRIVCERWPHVGDPLPEPAPTRRRAGGKADERRRDGRLTYELIEFEEGT